MQPVRCHKESAPNGPKQMSRANQTTDAYPVRRAFRRSVELQRQQLRSMALCSTKGWTASVAREIRLWKRARMQDPTSSPTGTCAEACPWVPTVRPHTIARVVFTAPATTTLVRPVPGPILSSTSPPQSRARASRKTRKRKINRAPKPRRAQKGCSVTRRHPRKMAGDRRARR